jgi:hypothetical protein
MRFLEWNGYACMFNPGTREYTTILAHFLFLRPVLRNETALSSLPGTQVHLGEGIDATISVAERAKLYPISTPLRIERCEFYSLLALS